jgi:hypothetical protein
MWNRTGSIDNLVEHLVIVPRTAQYGFEPYAYWNENHRPIWLGRSWQSIPIAQYREQALLLLWPTLVHNVSDVSVRRAGFATIRQQGLLGRAEKFNAELDRLLADKAAACSAAIKHLGLPAHQFRLAYCDPRNPPCLAKPLP